MEGLVLAITRRTTRVNAVVNEFSLRRSFLFAPLREILYARIISRKGAKEY